MNPNLRFKFLVRTLVTGIKIGAHLQNRLLAQTHKISFITVKGSVLAVLVQFGHFHSTGSVCQLMIHSDNDLSEGGLDEGLA